MTRFLSSLRFRLLVLVLLTLVPVLVLVMVTAYEQRQQAAIQAQENVMRLARAAAASQGQLVLGTEQLLEILAQLPAIQSGNTGECRQVLASLTKHNPRYTEFTVSNPDGHTFCAATSLTVPSGNYLTNTTVLTDVFNRSLTTRGVAVGKYGIGPLSGKSILAMAFPILDDANQVQAVILATLDLAALNELAAQSLLPSGSTLTVNDADGTILARYPDPERWIGKSVPEAPIFRVIQQRRAEGTTETIGEDGISRLYAFTPLQGLPANDLSVSVGTPTAVVYGEADLLLERNLIALAAVGVLTP